jgi:hypothetical protein
VKTWRTSFLVFEAPQAALCQRLRTRKLQYRLKEQRRGQNEYLLVLNLENEAYLQLVLDGPLESLPAKLAHSSHDAGSFDAWRRCRRPRLLGEPPRRSCTGGSPIWKLPPAPLAPRRSPTPLFRQGAEWV